MTGSRRVGGSVSALGRGVLGLTLLLALVASALARDEIREVPVRFAKGEISAVVNGHIRGYEVVDYILNVRKGQTMNVSMATRHAAAYFNILPPGSRDEAIFIGSSQGGQYEGVLRQSGNYRIRVYLMRSAARRNESAKYRLEIVVAGGKRPDAGGGHGTSGHPGSADSMLALCRDRASEVLKEPASSILAQYEGQRVDGTHAVNGSARRGRETFQCSFDRKGRRIVNFVVNNRGRGDR